jgi:hypothetical protein
VCRTSDHYITEIVGSWGGARFAQGLPGYPDIRNIEWIKVYLRLHRGMGTTRRAGAGLVVTVATVAAAACGAPSVSEPGGAASGADVRTPAAGSSVHGARDEAAVVNPLHDITDLSPSTRGLRFGAPANGIRHGELVLLIRNNGPAPVPRLMFTVEVPESVTADGGDWTGCTPLLSRKPGFPAGAKCEKGYLGVGESRTFRLGMRSPAAADGADSRVSRWLTDVWSAGERGEYCQDAAPEDNRKIFSVYRD